MSLVQFKSPEDTNTRRLHDYTRAKHIGKPDYETNAKYNKCQWTVIVQIDGTDRGTGKSTSKKDAEDAAAADALQKIGLDWVQLRQFRS